MAPVCQFLYIGTGKVMFGHIALQLLHLFLGGVLLYLRAAEPEAQPLGKHHLRYCQQQHAFQRRQCDYAHKLLCKAVLLFHRPPSSPETKR